MILFLQCLTRLGLQGGKTEFSLPVMADHKLHTPVTEIANAVKKNNFQWLIINY